ncbi:MAG: hypothetical protein ACREBU_05740 [Nitrososphaera sp.]
MNRQITLKSWLLGLLLYSSAALGEMQGVDVPLLMNDAPVPPNSFVERSFTVELPPGTTTWSAWKLINWKNFPYNSSTGVGARMFDAHGDLETVMARAWVTPRDPMPLESFKEFGGFNCHKVIVKVRCYNWHLTETLSGGCGGALYFVAE